MSRLSRRCRVARLSLIVLCTAGGCDLIFSYEHNGLAARGDAEPRDAASRGEAQDLRPPDVAPPPSPYSCVEHAACLLTCAAGDTDCPTECGAGLAPGAALPARYAELAACYEQQACAAQCGAFDTCTACLTGSCAEPLYYCFDQPEQASQLSCPELWTCAVRCQYGNPCGYVDGCHDKGDPNGQELAQAIIGGCNPTNPYLACVGSCPRTGFYFPCYLACNALGGGGIDGCLAAMRACFKDYR